MAADDPNDRLTEELREVEEDLAGLRPTVADLHERIGGRSEGPTDAAEQGALIAAMQEQEALLERLERRRADLLHRLGRE